MGSRQYAKQGTRSSKGLLLNWVRFPFSFPRARVFAGVVRRILRPNYPRRQTRLSRRPLGNTHHGSLLITSLRGCVTSSKLLTLTVDSHWRGCEQQRAGGAGKRRGEEGGRRRAGRRRRLRSSRLSSSAPWRCSSELACPAAHTPPPPRAPGTAEAPGRRRRRRRRRAPRSCPLAAVSPSLVRAQPATISLCRPL